MTIYADFETRGTVDLKKLGAMRYALDPLTQVLCLRWAYDQEDEIHLWNRNHPWIPKSDPPTELLERIAAGELFEAHNAKFEYLIWNYVLRREFPEFDVPLEMLQMRCSAAKASCLSLPRALGDAANAVQLENRKDTDGNRLINKLSKPMQRRRQKKGELPVVNADPVWCEEEIEHRRNWDYCAQDVRTERELSNFCPEMTERELEYWFMDFRMNLRGVKLDKLAATEAIKLCSREATRLDGEMQDLTGGQVLGGSKRIPFRAWANRQIKDLQDFGHDIRPLPDTRADTLSFELYGVPTKASEEAKIALKPKMDAIWDQRGVMAAPLKRAMEICLEVNRSSVAKFRTMRDSVCPDGRLHDIMLYNGADRPVSGDAEVLTRRDGWMRIEDWYGGEIAQWSHQKGGPGRITFAPATRAAFDYAGEMVRMCGPSSELLCTVDHKIPQYSCQGNLRDVAAGEVRECNWAVPLGGVLVGDFIAADVTRAVVMFQADGCIKEAIPGKSRTKFVLGFTKARKIERCRSLLKRLGIPFTEYKEKPGNFAVRFYIDVDDAPPWLRQSKQFGPWLLDHNPLVFTDELQHWDGTTDKRRISYSTCSGNNADWVLTMAALSGTRASKASRGVRQEGWNESFRVHVHNLGARSWLKKKWTFKREPSPGKVYCARTQTGYFLVRYKGTIQVTGNTGRWSGQGVQPHNFVRGYMKEMPGVWWSLLTCDADLVTLITGDLMLPALAKACRGALIASDNYELYAADFNAIEARKLAWMAGCASLLTLFNTPGGDPYCDMASGIFGRVITKADKSERQLGKKAILGLGYAMGWEKFQGTVYAEEGIWLDDEFCQRVVQIYRKEKYPEIPLLWKDVNKAAIAACEEGGEHFVGGDPVTGAGGISYFVSGRFLHCRLPSGRLLAYLDPEVHTRINYRFSAINVQGKPTMIMVQAKMGVPMNRVKRRAEYLAEKSRKTLTGDTPESFTSPHLSFMGRHILTKQWQRLGTHGGTLVENADQASSRDLLAEAMYRVDQGGVFDLLLSIHDEVIAEAPLGTASVKEFEAIMSEVPIWAPGMPISAEGWIGPRLRK